MIKRRKSLSHLKAQRSNDVADTGQPRPGSNNLVKIRLRRAFSVGDIRSPSSICQLPHLINKRHSYPSSPIPVVSRDLSHKTGCHEVMSSRRKNVTITCDFKIVNRQLEVEKKPANQDCIDIRLRPCKSKSQDCGRVQNTFRTHSTISAPNLRNRKPLQARRITLPSLSSSNYNTCTTVSEMYNP